MINKSKRSAAKDFFFEFQTLKALGISAGLVNAVCTLKYFTESIDYIGQQAYNID